MSTITCINESFKSWGGELNFNAKDSEGNFVPAVVWATGQESVDSNDFIAEWSSITYESIVNQTKTPYAPKAIKIIMEETGLFSIS